LTAKGGEAIKAVRMERVVGRGFDIPIALPDAIWHKNIDQDFSSLTRAALPSIGMGYF